MAVRQYIGARYVPRFMGVYDNTQVYEALDVVDNGMGTSYIAKKPTPAGTPLTDTDYWAVYGASSGAIINLQNQIDDMKDGTISGSLQNQISANADDIQDIETSLDFSTMKILFVGDSYGVQGTNWCDRCALKLGNSNYTNLSVSGEGFTTGIDGNGFKNQLVTYGGDRDDVNFIIVGGGLNDSTFNSAAGASTLSAAIADFMNYAKSEYPNAKIALAYMGCALDNSGVLAGRTMDKRRWAEFVYKNAATENGAIYCDIVNSIKLNTAYMSSDGVHPAGGGGIQLGYYYASFLLGDFIKVEYPKITLSPTYATFSKQFGSVKYDIMDPYIKLYIDDLALVVPSGTNITAFSDVTIMNFSELYFNEPVVLNSIARLDNFDNKNYQTVPIKLTLTGYDCKVCTMDSDGSAAVHVPSSSGGLFIIMSTIIEGSLDIMG